MDQCRLLIEQITRFFANPGSSPSLEEVRRLATSYANLGTDINAWLAECEPWLDAGEYSEALRIAEYYRILEKCKLLLFPRHEQWIAICKTYKMPVPPTLTEKTIKQLFHARDIVALTLQLLEQHRLGALRNDPVKDRLLVVYQLEKCDAHNGIWEEMIPEYEAVRYAEMDRQFSALPFALESKPIVDDLLKELRNSPWRTTPPDELVKRITSMAKKLHQQSLLLSLEQIVVDMQDGYNAQDSEKCGTAIDNWNHFIRNNRIALTMIPARIMNNTRAPMDWFARIDRQNELKNLYEEKLGQLRESLRLDEDVNEVVATYSAMSVAADNAGILIPEDVSYAYRERIGVLDQQNRRKARFVILTTFVVCVLIGLGVYLYVQHSLMVKRYTMEADNIRMCLDRFEIIKPGQKFDLGALVRAGKYIADLRETMPGALSNPVVREQTSRYDVLRVQEDKRSVEFGQTYDRARELDMTETLNSLVIQQLKLLARSEEEKEKADEMSRRYESSKTKDRALRDGRYRGQYDMVARKVSDLTGSRDVSPEQALEMIKGIESDLERLRAISEDVDPTLLRLGEKLEVTTAGLKELHRHEANIAREYDALIDAIGSQKLFAGGLKAIADGHKETAAGKEANDSITHLSASVDLDAWNEFVRQYADAYPTWGSDVELAKTTFKAFATLKERIAFVPECRALDAAIEQARDFVEAGGRKTVVDELDKLFGVYSTMLWLYRPNPQAYYYLIKKPTPDTVRVEFRLNKGTVRTAMAPFNPERELQGIIETPLCVLAQQTIKTTVEFRDRFDTDKWINMLEGLFEVFARNDPPESGWDPLVKVIVLDEVLHVVCKDPLFAEPFGQWYSAYKEHRDFDENLNWYDGREKKLVNQRRIAEAILQKLPLYGSLKDKCAQVRKAATNRKTEFNVEYEWIGFINVERSKYNCVYRVSKPLADGGLFLCRISPITARPELIPVGSYKDGKVMLDNAMPGLARGLPVYLKVVR